MRLLSPFDSYAPERVLPARLTVVQGRYRAVAFLIQAAAVLATLLWIVQWRP